MQYKFPLEINDVSQIRYSITSPDNGLSWLSRRVVWGRNNPKMSTTYAQLFEKHKARLAKETTSTANAEQIFRNHMTALRDLLRHLGKHESSPVGLEMSEHFLAEVERYQASQSGVSERTKADRRSLLKAWRATFIEMEGTVDTIYRGREQRSAKMPEALATPFHHRLRAALKEAGLTPKGAASRARVSASALGRWSRGALPNARSLGTLSKIEAVLSIPAEELVGLAKEALGQGQPLSSDEYRQRLKRATAVPYRLKVRDLLPSFLEQWRGFFRYKTESTPAELERHSRGRWSLAPAGQTSSAPTVLNSKGDLVSEAAAAFWSTMSAFLGYLRLPASENGFGQSGVAVQTLAWCAVPDAVEGHLNFMTERADGAKNGSHRKFCGYVEMLTHPVHGYLRQQHEFISTLPADAVSGDWARMCNQAYKIAKAWKAESQEQSRDPAAPLAYFFTHECALTPLFEAMGRLREDASHAARGSKEEAIGRRDEVLLGVLTSNPLRAKNLKSLTYRENNSGNVYRSSAGQWRIRIPGKMFKNKSRVGRDTYDVAVAPWLQGLFDDYVREFRPRLVAELDSGYFFVSSRGGGRFKDLNAQVRKVTRRLIPQCGGISPHAFRTLVATDWLQHHPNDFTTVAQLLNDTIAVVMKHYAKLKKDDAFSRYSEYVSNMRRARGFDR